MAILTNIEKANETNLLWSPIADAVDIFLKRRSGGAEGYERIWRLIHVWEAISTTLYSLGTARLSSIDPQGSSYRKCREHLHGKSWNEFSKSFDSYQGALDGSAIRRLDILMELSSNENPASDFLKSTKNLLVSSSINLAKLVLAWARVCEVPEDAKESDNIQVRQAMRHVNTFRNRFAHVPFPYDGLEEIADSLEDVTEQLFTVDPKPWQSFTDERLASPLTGSIHWRDRLLKGNMNYRADKKTETVQCIFPITSKKDKPIETWDCQPFIYIDSMVRPHILTRLLT